MEIDSKLAVNSGEALTMLDKLQVFFEENDAEDEVLRSVTSLTKKVEEIQETKIVESKKQKKYHCFFQVTFFILVDVNLNKNIRIENQPSESICLYFSSAGHKFSIF